MLYGLLGCGKILGVECLVWNIGLFLVKVCFDVMILFYLGEMVSNLRLVFDMVNESLCLLFLDECDFIVRLWEDS